MKSKVLFSFLYSFVCLFVLSVYPLVISELSFCFLFKLIGLKWMKEIYSSVKLTRITTFLHQTCFFNQNAFSYYHSMPFHLMRMKHEIKHFKCRRDSSRVKRRLVSDKEIAVQHKSFRFIQQTKKKDLVFKICFYFLLNNSY